MGMETVDESLRFFTFLSNERPLSLPQAKRVNFLFNSLFHFRKFITLKKHKQWHVTTTNWNASTTSSRFAQ